MSKKKSISFFMTTLGLGFCTLAQADQNFNQYYAANHRNAYIAYDDNVHSQMSDEDLTREIEDQISGGWFSKGYDRVNIQVKNGKVTLRGIVETQSDKDKLEKEVRNIEGVMGLDSQLTVQKMDSSESSAKKDFPQDRYVTSEDEQLNQRIRDAVSRGMFMNSYEDIILVTSKGIVVLEGKVDSVDDRQDLVDKIQKINGVKSVKSNLTVKE